MVAGNVVAFDGFRPAACATAGRAGRLIPAGVMGVCVALGACTDGAQRPAADSAASSAESADPPADSVAAVADSVAIEVSFRRGEELAAVERMVPAGQPLGGALDALLAGPTAAERAAGIESWFSAATRGMLRSVAVQGGVAVVDFVDYSRVIPNASSSFGSTMLLAELNATVFGNTDATAVEYRFDGSCDAFGEWIQRGCIRYERSRRPLGE